VHDNTLLGARTFRRELHDCLTNGINFVARGGCNPPAIKLSAVWRPKTSPTLPSPEIPRGTAKASVTRIFKLAQSASRKWRKLRGHHHIPDLICGVRFIDGVSEHQLREEELTASQNRTIQTEIVA